MRIVIGTIIIAGLSFFLGNWTWWVFTLPCFAVAAVLSRKSSDGFFMASLAIALLYSILVLSKNSQNDGILLDRISSMMQDIPSILILLLSILIPALLGGLAGWSGSLLHRILRPASTQDAI